MTIFYADDITDGQGLYVFCNILKRWRGSLYKLVWVDLLIYISAYYLLNLTYRFAMNENQKHTFEQIVEFCEKTKGDIPISFLLGFFVAGIITRWYQMYMYIPWMNEIALQVAYTVNKGDRDQCRNIRLTIMRYLNLSWILMMRTISDQIATRFVKTAEPVSSTASTTAMATKAANRAQKLKISRNTYHPWSIDATNALRPASRSFLQNKHETTPNSPTPDPSTPLAKLTLTVPDEGESGLISAEVYQAADDGSLQEDLRTFNDDKQVKRTFGIIITEAEIDAFKRIASTWYRRTKERYTPEYWVPIQWAQQLTLKAVESGHIADWKAAYYLIKEIGDLRKRMQELQIFSSIMIPLVYTQVVIIAVYSYFLCQIFACQFVESQNPNDKHKIDLYVPIFNIFSFLFLMGWLKVALCVMNPFGDDDEDFQTSQILSYNLEVSYRSVCMHPDSFPTNLIYPSKTSSEEMTQFLNEVEHEIERNMPSQEENNLHHLQIPRSTFDRLRRSTCCGRQNNHTIPGLIVTNADQVNPERSTEHPSHHLWSWLSHE